VRIGELARRTGLTTKTIRFYEQAGVLPEPERQPSGYRDYDESALARLRFVRAAQAAGLTLAEIRQVIDVREQTGPPCRHVAELLDAHAADLDRRIDQLTALRDEVRHLRHRADRLDPASCAAAAVCHVIPTSAAPGAATPSSDHVH
jgi:DNA-binding transcriptional MerR regulator